MPESSKVASQLGRNRLLATLGQGGMGTIWLAVAGGLGEFRKLLVVKELRWDLTRNHHFVEMFLDEAKVAARLNHPNVVQTLEAGQEGDRYFLSMEFLDGQPLSDVLQRAIKDAQLSLAMRLRVLCGALSGLHYAHELRDYDGTELRIVHRDVSPQNIFVTYDGQVKMVDFGIAKAADADGATEPGVFKGKFAYASPEQIKGQAIDRRADIFAIGVLLWEVVTLQRFARAKPTQESIDARLSGTEPRLAEIDPDVDPLLAEICDRAMQVDPAARFATADDFRVALEQYLMLSGERSDAASTAVIMQSAFANERAAMHKLIDAHLKDANFSESLVRRLRPLVVDDPAEHEPTAVADLSELVHSTRGALRADLGTQLTQDWRNALRQNNRTRWLAAGAALGIVALVAYLFSGDSSHSAPAANVGTPAPETPAANRAPTAAAREPVAPAPAVPAPAVPSTPSLPTRPAEVVPVPPNSVALRPALDARVPARPQAAAESSSNARAQTSPIGNALPGVPNKERVSISPRKLAADANVSGLTKAIPEPADNADHAAQDDIGQDLRALRKNEKRKLDLEDPFR